jgi:hypothetical protein
MSNKNNCFSNLTRKQINKQQRTEGNLESPNLSPSRNDSVMRGAQERQIRQMAVAKKVRKSYEQLAFIEKARNTGGETAINGRYLSVGFNNQRLSK